MAETSTVRIQEDLGRPTEDATPTTVSRRGGPIEREQFLAMISASKSRPTDLKSGEANMLRLFQTFIDLYLPKPTDDSRPLMAILTTPQN